MVFRRVAGFKPFSRDSLVCGLVVLAISAAACGGSGFEYVSSSDRKAFFKVPNNWEFYDKREILVANGQSLSPQTDQQFPWLIAFDSDPNPSIEHVLSSSQSYPVIQAAVQNIGGNFQLRDSISLGTMRNVLYNVDQLIQENRAEILAYEDIELPGGFHGIDMEFNVVLRGVGGVQADNVVVRVRQVTVVDPAIQTLYVFHTQCESHCYRDNKTLLDQIADSWTVKER